MTSLWIGLLLTLASLSCQGAPEAKKVATTPAPTTVQDVKPTAYKLEKGPFDVLNPDELLLHDEKRNKDLPVTIRIPKGAGPFPVVVFSHGLGGAGKNYFPLTEHWASHGYVCIQPTHADSLSLRSDSAAPRSRGLASLLDPIARENRAKDVSFVLDSLDSLEERIPELKGKMDKKRIGVGGHSFGAYTSVMLAGAIDNGKSLADPRPQAFLLLSGQGKSEGGLQEGAWDKITRPMMVMSGSLDTGRQGEGPQWRMEAFHSSPPGDKYSVFIEGATHMSFTGRLAEENSDQGGLRKRRIERQTKGTDQKAIFDDIKVSTLAFWDSYLKNDENAKRYLSSNALPEFSQGAIHFEKK